MTPTRSHLAGGLTLVGGLLTILLRIVPHPANLSPIGAMGIFGGARLRSWQAYLLPLVIMAATDMCLWALHGFDADYSLWHFSRPFVYGSFMLYVLIGRTLVNTNSPLRIGGASLLGSVQFFFITNFQAWLELPDLYSRDSAGLMQCYIAGLPFAVRTVLGDLVFSALLFGVHELATTRQPASDAEPVASA